jgi:hypothetical protein
MESFIKNKNALIWAFNECIDKDTKFEGNTLVQSINENKNIISYLLSVRCFNRNITEAILSNYLAILNDTYSVIPLAVNQEKSNEYLFCGWRGHAILLFWEKQENNIYNFGLINCGEGNDLQGNNGVLCNGLIIFKNIKMECINDFLSTYKNYEANTINDPKFTLNKIHNIFYFILFDKLLNINGKVDFEELLTLSSHTVEYYKINSQVIGSCAFTNLITLIYYMHVKTQIGVKSSSQCYTDYLIWYKRGNLELKKKIYDDILASRDTTYYNIYQYILDTTDIPINEEYEP